MQVLAELRERRAYFGVQKLVEGRPSFNEMWATVRQVYNDSTVIINVESEYATPKMVRAARYYRGLVVDFLLNRTDTYSNQKEMFSRHRTTAVKDMRILLADPDTAESEVKFAKKSLKDLGADESSSGETEESIIYSFFPHINNDELRAAFQTDDTLRNAIGHRNAFVTINENMVGLRTISKSEGVYLGLLECNKGIDLLSNSSSDMAQKLLAGVLGKACTLFWGY